MLYRSKGQIMFERCLYFNSNALTRKLNAQWAAAFAKYELPASHGYLLRLVLAAPGLSQQVISDELNLEKSTIARFVTQLEKRGLIFRKVSEVDPRQKCVFPTETAKVLHDDLEELGNALYRAVCTKLGKERVADMVASLKETAKCL